MELDGEDWEVKTIPEASLWQLLQISRRDPVVYACLGEYMTMLKLNDIVLEGSSPNPMAIDNIIHRDYTIPFASEAFILLQVWGFCPYVLTEAEVDAKHDTWWMSQFKAINTDGKSRLPTLHVPVFGTYWVQLLLNKKDNRQSIRCVDKRELGPNGKSPDMWSTTKMERANNDFPRIGVIQTLISTNRPDFYNASINTGIATIANSYNSINNLESFANGAHYANAYPLVAMQRIPVVAQDVLDTINTELYGTAENDPDGPQETYITKKGVALELEDEYAKMEAKQAKMTDGAKRFYEARTGDVLNVKSMPLTRPLETSKHYIDPNWIISPNQPPQPVPPPDMTDRHNRHNQFCCNSLKLPYSILSRDGVVKQYSNTDLQLLTKTVRFLQTDLNHIFSIILTELKLIGHYKLSIHPQVFVEFEQMIKMAEFELISREQFRDLMQDSQSLARGPLPKRTIATNSSSSNKKKKI